ncbi:MAG: hypothetical protein JSU69_08385 [Candidatus Zixiibacteriota bacterium]|nr:MAG: hypothetical protein JSU69_08385 [candidate division Zixibacteria bacterium]
MSSFAETGQVYPDTAGIGFSYETSGDTVSVLIENLYYDSIGNFIFCAHTNAEPILIDLLVDGTASDSAAIDHEHGTIYPDKMTTRWTIAGFYQTFRIRYYLPPGPDNNISWSAGYPYAMFGTPCGIGPPRNLTWVD